jgi:hypothetical protein
MRIYNCNGWIDTSDESGARETCQRHPDEWTLHPWIRPGGAANVNLPHDWQFRSASDRIELARQIKGWDMPGETAEALGITHPVIADEIIRAYVGGSQHPAGSYDWKGMDPAARARAVHAVGADHSEIAV